MPKLRNISVIVLIALLCISVSSAYAHTNGAQNMSVSYPLGTPCPGTFCDYYFADTHFSFSIYWNNAPIFQKPTGYIIHTDGTYTSCTGCAPNNKPYTDWWEQERLTIGSEKNAFGIYNTIYDSSAHDGHQHTQGYGSHLDDYYPNTYVTLSNNYVMAYFQLQTVNKLTGQNDAMWFPKRYRQDFN